MRVYIGPYKDWFGPYQLAEALCFWVKERPDEDGIPDKPDWVHRFGEWLAHGSVEPEPEVGEIRSLTRERPKTWLYRFLLWLHGRKDRQILVQIDRWDTWSMDSTLAYIVLPMLRQLKETKHGSPWTDDEDVPEHLRSTSASPKESEWDLDEHHHARWDWILDEMIFAFSSKIDDDWQDQFYSGEASFAVKKLESGNSEMIQQSSSFKVDREGMQEYQARITNGFKLFGKYYENLWD
jgi:hypothetical protein